MRPARPLGARLGAGLAVVALALAGCSGDDGGRGSVTTDGGDTGADDVVQVPGVVTGADSLVFLDAALRVVAPCDGSLCVWTSNGALADRWDGGGIVADASPGVYTDRIEDGAVELVLLDEVSGREMRAVEAYEVDDVQDGPGQGLRDIELSPDGTWVAAVGADGVVRRWTARGLDDGLTIDTGTDAVAVAWSADGSRVAVAASDGPVTIRDAATGEETARLDAPPQGDVVWSDDGAHLATASFALDEEAATTVWDATTLQDVASLARPGDRLAFMGEDALVLSEKGALDVQAWSWTTDATTAFSGATDPPRAVMVSRLRVYAASPRDGVLGWGVGGGDAPTVFEKPEG
ncbi:WD40 repeat domain-containing protein [Microvirga sp. 0TCS3.31]